MELNIPPLSDLAVSLYLPGTVQATTVHANAFQTSYLSLPGDFTAAPTLPVQRTIALWPFLTGVKVEAAGPAIVTLGDSITDGTRSTPDTSKTLAGLAGAPPADRARPHRGHECAPDGVNHGINGNRLLSNTPDPLFGRGALERFDRDVLSTPGVRYLTVLIGINDIGNSSAANLVTLEDLVAG